MINKLINYGGNMFRSIKRNMLLSMGILMLGVSVAGGQERADNVQSITSNWNVSESVVLTRREISSMLEEALSYAIANLQISPQIDEVEYIEEIIQEYEEYDAKTEYVIKGAVSWSEANILFPRYATATVIDVLTGESFRIKRTFGGNHADVETLTQEDTDIMYQLWRGHSWDRRAVVIIVDDTNYVLAGSMNGMPHAGLDRYPALAVVNNRSGGFGRGVNLDMVKGNGMDGHVCLHFAGSTTHGSGNVSDSHQRMVDVAARFIAENF